MMRTPSWIVSKNLGLWIQKCPFLQGVQPELKFSCVVTIWDDLSMNVLRIWNLCLETFSFQLINVVRRFEDSFLDSGSRNVRFEKFYYIVTRKEILCVVTMIYITNKQPIKILLRILASKRCISINK